MTHRYSHGTTPDEDDPPPEPLEAVVCPQTSTAKPCHCNCFYKRRTKRALRRSKLLSYRRCNCLFYSFRRTGIHPPYM
ncbi:hypothetical protein JWV37_05840 [Sulfurospirillum sp. T05]|uniref:Uncharacterized protein n=1 Tax=Sulfurospirillum tamanense TaxID=2813362 RepID=A0ABS2WRS6_9BACT|nr:hypothetical protein [Sulfurospirillum tamanensis]MBN2964292.1 hypothetical protein [Sulfurospirillum tamanensis]